MPRVKQLNSLSQEDEERLRACTLNGRSTLNNIQAQSFKEIAKDKYTECKIFRLHGLLLAL